MFLWYILGMKNIKKVFEQYKENEKYNLHSENRLLLAKLFDDEHAITACETAIHYDNKLVPHSVRSQAREYAQELTRDYYYKLKSMVSKGLISIS